MAYQANARSGNRAQKDRGQVSHTTAKLLFKQKGTVAHGQVCRRPRCMQQVASSRIRLEENFSQKLNRKMYRAGIASILSQLVREDRLAVVDNISVDAPKTKLFAQKIKGMGYDKVLVITDSLEENVFLASRNLPNVLVLEVNEPIRCP